MFYVLLMAVVMLQQQHWVVVTKTTGPVQPKILLSAPFWEMFAGPDIEKVHGEEKGYQKLERADWLGNPEMGSL